MREFLKKAFNNMRENMKEKHKVDRANSEAVKAESIAQWEEAKAMGDPEKRKSMLQAERDKQIALGRNFNKTLTFLC